MRGYIVTCSSLGFKGRTFVSSGFSTDGTLISMSAVPHCGGPTHWTIWHYIYSSPPPPLVWTADQRRKGRVTARYQFLDVLVGCALLHTGVCQRKERCLGLFFQLTAMSEVHGELGRCVEIGSCVGCVRVCVCCMCVVC